MDVVIIIIELRLFVTSSLKSFQPLKAATCDFQQCGILTREDSDEPVQLLFKLRNSQ